MELAIYVSHAFMWEDTAAINACGTQRIPFHVSTMHYKKLFYVLKHEPQDVKRNSTNNFSAYFFYPFSLFLIFLITYFIHDSPLNTEKVQ